MQPNNYYAEVPQPFPYDEEAYNNPPKGSYRHLLSLANLLALMTFEGFVCYSLVVSNTQEVQTACGTELWKLVLAQCILGVCLVFVIIVATVAVMGCCFGFGEDSVDAAIGMPFVFAIVVGVVLLVYTCTFLGWGAPIVISVFGSQPCLDALSAVSATGSPLLAIMASIYLIGDALILLGMLVGACAMLLLGYGNRTAENSFAVPP
jgi:hypothetical protein